ncbi:heme d1 biosynthesis radical SAM protein NirJ [Sulfuritortus calidifontis]|uniref:Pre-heme d1 synthase n=1 Tax=Sulfuritortus calidifontis TaxID=1914471 RepID=A0A4R3JYI8_9PROT|nr:heme d1 biosynthesis radical SAM protein NirJ [Sulfuritortus calidifontis]TCS73850.1 heme d1 biosynthesis radical SAM protein NirJ [Sulfuritortus calidifontis]
MFRVTQFMQEILDPRPIGPRRNPPGPVVIWNLIRRCNLTCLHCYSISADKDFPGELNTAEVFRVMDDLKAFGVPVLILSGGEPLLRPDIYDIAQRAKAMGFYVGLSSNGTLIDETNVDKIAAVGFDYVGISLDGLKATHDKFRRKPGGFEAALGGIRLCRDAGAKVGLRFTLTQDNAQDLPGLLDLMEAERIDKFYLSHLNYAGRGNRNRKHDAHFRTTRQAMDLIFDRCWRHVRAGRPLEFVTGNNDADGPYLLAWAQEYFPERAEHIRQKLLQWGGNASGVNVANIDNLGNVHPDTMWWNYCLGNVRERPFSRIWPDVSDPLMAGLKRSPRPVKGRCAACRHLAICNGNTRVRAWQTTEDFWAEDPGCYLTDEEIGLVGSEARHQGSEVVVTP